MRLGHPEDQVPVVPRALRKLSCASPPKRVLELLVAQRCAQCLDVSVSSDIHDLSDQAMAVLEGALRRLPPDVFAGEECQVHSCILHASGGWHSFAVDFMRR